MPGRSLVVAKVQNVEYQQRRAAGVCLCVSLKYKPIVLIIADTSLLSNTPRKHRMIPLNFLSVQFFMQRISNHQTGGGGTLVQVVNIGRPESTVTLLSYYDDGGCL